MNKIKKGKRVKTIEDTDSSLKLEGDNTEVTVADSLPLPIEDLKILPPTPIVDEDSEDTEKSKEIVPYDPLQAYLRDIRRTPPLSPEEEQELAIKYYKNKDLEAAYRLVTGTLWLVVKIAREYERAARTLLDLIQEGNIGLMEAVKNFDPYRGVRFPNYATWWIKAYIIRYLIANWRLVKIGTTQAQRKLFFNLNKEKEQLEKEGIVPTTKLLADRLSVRESDIIEMEQRLGSPDLSFDAPLQSDTDTNLLSVLPSDVLSAEDIISNHQAKTQILATIAQFQATLTEREQFIFKERLLNEERSTLEDVADRLSISRERVRQIENRLKDRLKKFILEKLGQPPEAIEIE